MDAFHSYHSFPLDSEQDRVATTFVMPWGRLRFVTYPQGFVSPRDAYTDHKDRLTGNIPRLLRSIDDTLTYNNSIEAAFFRAAWVLPHGVADGLHRQQDLHRPIVQIQPNLWGSNSSGLGCREVKVLPPPPP